ncbi:MAG: hypothetical protein KA105_08235 [Caulobacter sp.]|jgi:hypothetical protein|nr:hypothetical protein [Caulobacter sp.]
MIKKNLDRDRPAASAQPRQPSTKARILDFGAILKFRREQPGGLRAHWRKDKATGRIGRLWFVEE